MEVARDLGKFGQERLRFLQVERVEPFGKPAVHRSEQFDLSKVASGRNWHLADMPAALIDVRYRG